MWFTAIFIFPALTSKQGVPLARTLCKGRCFGFLLIPKFIVKSLAPHMVGKRMYFFIKKYSCWHHPPQNVIFSPSEHWPHPSAPKWPLQQKLADVRARCHVKTRCPKLGRFRFSLFLGMLCNYKHQWSPINVAKSSLNIIDTIKAPWHCKNTTKRAPKLRAAKR